MRAGILIAIIGALVEGGPNGGTVDGRVGKMMSQGLSPGQRGELKRRKKMEQLSRSLRGVAIPRSLIAPPLAPALQHLQNLVDNVAVTDKDGKIKSEPVSADMLPCLLRPGGCKMEKSVPDELKNKTSNGLTLKKTEAQIEKAVTKLQKDLDMRTAEVVKEIERRAAEMRRRITQEAEQLIEAVKYLVTMLSDSVTRADEMGQGFVREWFDDALNRYVGDTAKNAKLDKDIDEWNNDLKGEKSATHDGMIKDLKTSINKTREQFGAPEATMDLDEELGLEVTGGMEDAQIDTQAQTAATSNDGAVDEEAADATTTGAAPDNGEKELQNVRNPPPAEEAERNNKYGFF